MRRDRDTDAELTSAGWLVVRVWGHEEPVAAAGPDHRACSRPTLKMMVGES